MHLPRSFEEVIVLAEQSGHKVQGRGRRGDDVRVGGLKLHVWPVGTAFVASSSNLSETALSRSRILVMTSVSSYQAAVCFRGALPEPPAKHVPHCDELAE